MLKLKLVEQPGTNALLDACDAINAAFNANRQCKYTFVTAGWDGESDFEQKDVARWWTDEDVLLTLLALKKAKDEQSSREH